MEKPTEAATSVPEATEVPAPTAVPEATATPAPTAPPTATEPPAAEPPQDLAIDFSLPSASGETVSLSSYRGQQTVILVFSRGLW